MVDNNITWIGEKRTKEPMFADQIFELPSDDNTLIATASFDATTRLWDANTGENLAIFKGQLLSPHSVMFTNDGKRLFVGTGEGTVKVWDIATKNELMTLDTKLKTSVRKIYLKDNGNLILLSGFSGNILSKYYSVKSVYN